MFYVATICDGEGCGDSGKGFAHRKILFGQFDHPGETAADALAAMEAAGWKILPDGSTLCPSCSARNTAVLPSGEALRRMIVLVPVKQ